MDYRYFTNMAGWKPIWILMYFLQNGCLSADRDYCSLETFEAGCEEGEVVLMQAARLGRMQLGRCVKQDFGYLGCAVDVLPILDRKCSGRRRCTLPVFTALGNLKPCSELETFLQARYACLQVSDIESEPCTRQGVAQVRNPTGYISSYDVRSSVVGRRGCPILLQAARGQRWNITLLDFGVTSQDDPAGEIRVPLCQKYAVIQEAPDTGSPGTVVCGGHYRERIIYVSNSDSVTVDIVSSAKDDRAEFLLQYEVLGCPLPDNPNIAVLTRDETETRFQCNLTGETWTLQCHGTQWVGHPPPCLLAGSEGPRWSLWQTLSDDWTTPSGLLLVVGLGLGLGILVGLLLLGLAVIYYRRRRRSLRGGHIHQTGQSSGRGAGGAAPPSYWTSGMGKTATAASTDAFLLPEPTAAPLSAKDPDRPPSDQSTYNVAGGCKQGSLYPHGYSDSTPRAHSNANCGAEPVNRHQRALSAADTRVTSYGSDHHGGGGGGGYGTQRRQNCDAYSIDHLYEIPN